MQFHSDVLSRGVGVTGKEGQKLVQRLFEKGLIVHIPTRIAVF